MGAHDWLKLLASSELQAEGLAWLILETDK